MRLKHRTQIISQAKTRPKKSRTAFSPPPPQKKNKIQPPESSSHLPLLLYLSIPPPPPPRDSKSNECWERVTGMLEFHRIVGDYLSSALRRLFLCASRKCWMEDWVARAKSLCHTIQLDPALEDKRCFSQERMPPRQTFVKFFAKETANHSFLQVDAIRNCSYCNRQTELSNRELDPFIASLINSLLLISLPYYI